MLLLLPILVVVGALVVAANVLLGRLIARVWKRGPVWAIVLCASLPVTAALGFTSLRLLNQVQVAKEQVRCGVDACGYAGIFGASGLLTAALAFAISAIFLTRRLNRMRNSGRREN